MRPSSETCNASAQMYLLEYSVVYDWTRRKIANVWRRKQKPRSQNETPRLLFGWLRPASHCQKSTPVEPKILAPLRRLGCAGSLGSTPFLIKNGVSPSARFLCTALAEM